MTENLEQAVKSNSRQGTLFIIISAVGFGLLAIFTKFAYKDNVGIFTLLTLRFLLAGMFLGLVLYIRKECIKVTQAQLIKLISFGVMGYAVMSSCFFFAVKLIPASIASILLYTYPVLVTILSYLLFKEPITKQKIKALILSFVGLILVVGLVFNGLNPLGLLSAFGAAVVYSLYITLSGKAVKEIPPNVVSFYIIISAGTAFLLAGLSTQSLNFNISLQGWLSILGIAFFSTGIAIITFFKGMQIIGPSKASIISTVEPIITTVAALVLFNEQMTLLQVAGGCLIVLAVIRINKEE